jgi:hypothetical protein
VFFGNGIGMLVVVEGREIKKRRASNEFFPLVVTGVPLFHHTQQTHKVSNLVQQKNAIVSFIR